jgi:effector-binding domain-containing protein
VPAALILCLLAGFLLLPSKVVLSEKMFINANQNGVVRLLTEKDKWQQWWPADQSGIVYDSLNFSFQQELAKMAVLQVPYGDTLLPVQLNIVFTNRTSSAVLFQVSLPEATSPLQKVSNYFKGRKIENGIEDILQRLKAFAEKEENIYGFVVRQEKVKDSALVATRFEMTGYPDTKQIYSAVADLRRYIDSAGAKETGPPMLHIDADGNQQYRAMVAIPVDRLLDGNGQIEPKRMVLGKILVTEVKGGSHTVEKAMQSFQAYVTDHRRTSPAMPYQSLVTNRQQEPDSTQWVTRLYYPVF